MPRRGISESTATNQHARSMPTWERPFRFVAVDSNLRCPFRARSEIFSAEAVMCKRHIYAPSSSFRRCRRKHSSVRRGGNGARKFSVNGRLNGVRTELGQRVRGWLFGAACATPQFAILTGRSSASFENYSRLRARVLIALRVRSGWGWVG